MLGGPENRAAPPRSEVAGHLPWQGKQCGSQPGRGVIGAPLGVLDGCGIPNSLEHELEVTQGLVHQFPARLMAGI
jgi:hypothetical protein